MSNRLRPVSTNDFRKKLKRMVSKLHGLTPDMKFGNESNLCLFHHIIKKFAVESQRDLVRNTI